MTAGEDASGLLLVRDGDQSPAAAEPVALVSSRKQAPAKMPAPGELGDDHNHPNDLAVQRWAVIAQEGPAGDELIRRIKPLIEARRREQDAPVREFRVPSAMTADEAARWKRTVYQPSERHRKDLPRYQLILGDLDAVSQDLQVSQAVDGFVGRLAFDRPEQYAAYCEKLLLAEQGGATGARAVFHAVRDGTAATELGYKGLVRPCVESARDLRGRGRGEFPAELLESGGDEPDPDEFREAIRERGVLLSMSHGVGAPRGGWKSAAAQRAGQGAMSFGRDFGALGGADLAGVPCVPGGVWLMFACFGAGTPTTSKYTRWLKLLEEHGELGGALETVLASLPRAGERPFVAALPKAVLASERGPLAFIGHVDLAWTYSFREVDLGRPILQTGRFVDPMAALLRGDRVGVAFDMLFRWFAQVSVDLGTLDAEDSPDPLRRARMWMLRQDLAGFTLLGDPAARVVSPPAAVVRAAAPVAPMDFFAGMTVLPSAAPARVELGRLEAAFGQLLAGTGDAGRLAAGLGMTRAQLEDEFRRYRAAGRAAIGR